jgi:2-polyprenyl-3-methyl-5-hydroxy-6-metoxy-1,4-benzoquinol methylase
MNEAGSQPNRAAQVDGEPHSRSAEEMNDELARTHSIDAYYESSPLPIRLIERKRLQIIREMVGDATGLALAEVGSGGGHVLRMFRSARLTAFDVSDVFLANARKNLVGYDVNFVKGEVDKLDLPAHTFDRMICTEVLEHTIDPEAILAAMARLLKSEGVAVITIPNDPLINRLKDLVSRTPGLSGLRKRVEAGGTHFHLHQWTPDEFARVLARHFRVTARRAAPFEAVPIRACYRCVQR